MALLKKLATNLKSEENTGFGANSSNSAGRFYNRSGGPNVIKKGVGILNRYSWYHTMLAMSRTKFLIQSLFREMIFHLNLMVMTRKSQMKKMLRRF